MAVGQWRDLPALNSVGFAATVAVTGVSISTGSAAPAGLLALITAIIAWDLGNLQQRLIRLQIDEIDPILFRQHLYRLSVVVALGVVVPLLGFVIQVGLTIVWAIVLGLIITISLSLTISLIRRYYSETG